MEEVRKPFQGVLNIIHFNWHFYVLAIVIFSVLLCSANYVEPLIRYSIYLFCFLALATVLISLLASLYIYDLSGLYNLQWIDMTGCEKVILNISAGFDETSGLLKKKFKNAEVFALDFYDPRRHTEVSIKRARKAYAPFPGTKQTQTTSLQFADNVADKILVTLSAHEIRNEDERAGFFKELRRIIKPTGQIYITEHLRDAPNFVAYNIGFFHFYSKYTWKTLFKEANLIIKQEIKLTPYISTFILIKNGNAS